MPLPAVAILIPAVTAAASWVAKAAIKAGIIVVAISAAAWFLVRSGKYLLVEILKIAREEMPGTMGRIDAHSADVRGAFETITGIALAVDEVFPVSEVGSIVGAGLAAMLLIIAARWVAACIPGLSL